MKVDEGMTPVVRMVVVFVILWMLATALVFAPLVFR